METFGYLQRIVSISVKKQSVFQPWFFYLPIQQETHLSLSYNNLNGGTWVVDTTFSEIFGGPFGPRAANQTPKAGHSSLEDAIDTGAPVDDYNRINFTEPPAKNITGDIPIHSPNIWQQTGFTQPKDKHGLYTKPTGALAEVVANAFETDWNSTSRAYNAEWQAHDGSVGSFFVSYPTSSFAVPIGNPSDPHTKFAFTAGIPAAFWLFNGGSTLAAAIYASNIKVAQLDPEVWDTDLFPPVRR